MANKRTTTYTKDWRLVYDDPPAMVRLARNRTRFMLNLLSLIDYDLQRLVTSAYLQGVADTAEVLFRQGYVPPNCDYIDKGAGI